MHVWACTQVCLNNLNLYELTIWGLCMPKRVYVNQKKNAVFWGCVWCLFGKILKNNLGSSSNKHLCGWRGQCILSLETRMFKGKIWVTLYALWSTISSLKNPSALCVHIAQNQCFSGSWSRQFTNQHRGETARVGHENGMENSVPPQWNPELRAPRAKKVMSLPRIRKLFEGMLSFSVHRRSTFT